jgi:hypothetical protein
MLKVDKKTLDRMEVNYPGIREQILSREEAVLPKCPQCGSTDTAKVEVGIIGRTIHIAAATSKFKLLPNGPVPGKYFCGKCAQYFD